MNVARYHAACVVYQGSIVVSGGLDINDNDSSSVESYDVFADEWSTMPDMLSSKSFHSLVVAKDKLFVVGYGRDICEVYDSTSKKFVAIKKSRRPLVINKALSIGNRILCLRKRVL